LKFKKGSEHFFTNIEIHCGPDNYVGGAADANNFYDHEILIEVACGPVLELQFTDKDGQRKAMEAHTRIVPMAVQEALRKEGTRVILTPAIFNSAHNMKFYTQHVWVEGTKK